MRLDLYHAETARIAAEQSALLDMARQRLAAGSMLTPLEQNGVLHALQVLIENAIGKAKQLLRASGEAVPVSAYDAFAALVRHGEIEQAQLAAWNAVIGLRNRIVRDYMNIDMAKVLELVSQGRNEFVVEFLLAQPISKPTP
jgi:uncharacterized protein YutE (UPF0331/DUF86 family)